MFVDTQLVEVGIGGTNILHYKSLGYDDITIGDKIQVQAKDLTPGSHVLVDVICDYCGCTFKRVYKTFNRSRKTNIKDSCEHCSHTKKNTETVKKKYGVNNIIEIDGVKDKIKQTNLERYNVENASSSEYVRNKVRETNIERYGYPVPSMNPDVKKKHSESFKKKYYQNPDNLKELLEKRKKTNLERYGVENPLQNDEIRAKALKTLTKNNSVPTSKQQLQLYDLLSNLGYENITLNYPFSKCCLDILLEYDNILIDIEYDGWYWHRNKQSDIKRDKFLQKNGFKVLRIKSGHLLPTDDQILNCLNTLINEDKLYSEIILSDWKEYRKEAI